MNKITIIPCPTPKCNADMGKIINREDENLGIMLLLQVHQLEDDPDNAKFICKTCGNSYIVYLTANAKLIE